MSTLQKNQHYVWQNYLRNWEIKGKVCCFRQAQKRSFCANTKNMASETFFYKVYRLSEDDRRYLESIINHASEEELRESHRQTVNLFQLPFTLRDQVRKLPLGNARRKELEIYLSETGKNIGELYHTQAEGAMVAVLESLNRQNCDFFADQEKSIEFIHFLSLQFFRTPKLRKIAEMLENPYPNLDLRRTAVIEAFIYSHNIASAIFSEKENYGFEFLKIENEVEFITGDQPVINLNRNEKPDLMFYYPLGPKAALIFSKEISYPNSRMKIVQEAEVHQLNTKIFEESVDQIYGSDKSYLEQLAKKPKPPLIPK